MMAIISGLPGLKIEVLVGGVPLEEYVDTDEEDLPNTVAKYIEAESGAEFEIRFILTPPFPSHDILFDFYLDGKYARGTFAFESDYLGNRFSHTVSGINTVKGDVWYLERFCFSELHIDETDAQALGEDLKKELEGVGEITVNCHKVNNIRPSEGEPRRSEHSTPGTIPEKALKGKAVSHHANFRRPETTEKGVVSAFDYMESREQPYASYKYRYRSRSALKALCIIPRTPSPVPLEERDVNDLNPNEMRELLRRQRARDATDRNIKQEGVKRERSPEQNTTAEADDDDVSFLRSKRIHRPSTLNEDGVEVIDLT